MAYSYTEKKRIRKDFGKRSSICWKPSSSPIGHSCRRIPPPIVVSTMDSTLPSSQCFRLKAILETPFSST